ncbi:MFS transporter [Streptomyces sp. NPDC051567]|uniref:MFS transporter n=1 Tax=Streptomyces sp. NPDC051567 TaxID=3365660 RepID=UPI0037AEE3BC
MLRRRAHEPAGPPRTRAYRGYLAAMLIDAVGNGLWAPVALIFFTRAQDMPMAQVGAALSAGGLIGLALGPLGGNLVDRWGPLRPALLSNVVRAGVLALFPTVGSAWQLVVLAALFAASDRVFWTANAPMVARLVPTAALPRALGTQNVMRIGGFMAGGGVGAAASGALFASPGGLHLLAYANAVSYCAAALLLLTVRVPAAPTARAPGPEPADGPGWRALLDDRPFLLLCLVQLSFALASESLSVMLPLVALNVMDGPSWLPGAAVLTASLSLLAAKVPAAAYAESRPRPHSLVAACLVFAGAFLLLSSAEQWDKEWAAFVILGAALVGTVGDALFVPVMTTMAHEAAPDALKGRYSAAFQTSWGLANVLAPALFAGLLSVGNGVLWLALTGLVLLTLPAVHRLGAGRAHTGSQIGSSAG